MPNKEVGAVLLLLVALFGAASPSFRTFGNLENILVGFSHLAILAIGEALPILLGGIDLSVGSIMGLVGMASFDALMVLHWPGLVVAPLALTVAALAGAASMANLRR